MKTREWVVKLLLLVIPILFLGGCKMFENKPTLTKEQQRNVVRWIARGYNINKVQFLRFEKNNFTGSYSLLFRVNNKNNTNIVEVENLFAFYIFKNRNRVIFMLYLMLKMVEIIF